MGTPLGTAVLSDDHLDLLVTAACRWRLLTSRTAAAFSLQPDRAPVVTATETGQLLRTENEAAVRWLTERGRTRWADRGPVDTYVHREVDHLDPVEVIKAAHAAQAVCAASPSWSGSRAQRLLAAIITAATHRLSGYRDAPWAWTRPQRRTGLPVGVTTGQHPDIPELTWVAPEQLGEHWASAPLVIVTTAAATAVPADLPARSGVFVLAEEGEHPNRVWQALTELNLQALVLFWPTARPWLLDQLREPAVEFVEHRGQ